MTCVSGASRCASRSTSIPSTFGILRSVRTTSKASCRIRWSAVGAVLRLVDGVAGAAQHDRGRRAHVALVVDDEDLAARARRSAGALGGPGSAGAASVVTGAISAHHRPVFDRAGRRAGTGARRRRPDAGHAPHAHLAPVPLDDPPHHREPEPGAARLRREERLEDALADLVRDARAGVLDLEDARGRLARGSGR